MELDYPGEKLRIRIAMVFSLLFWAGLGFFLTWRLAVILAVFGLIYLFAQSAFISYLRGTAVRVGPLQLPELNAHLLAACRRLNIEGSPEIYLLHAEGLFNALAVRFLGRDYVVLFASVVETLEPLPAALDFYIGHELARLSRGHHYWKPFLLPAQILPLLGPALSRAWEYTCDRHGLAACENPAYAKIALAAMAAGRSNWKKVNLRTYQEQVQDTRGFWMAYHELTSDSPWLVKRFAVLSALADKEEPGLPARNPLAFVLAFFTPRMPGSGGGFMSVVVAMVFIGILAGVAVPAYQDYLQRGAVAAAFEQSRPLRQSIEKLAALQLRIPTLAELDAQPLEMRQGGMHADIEAIEGGRIRMAFEGGPFKGETLLLYPEALEGNLRALEWHCTGDLAVRLHPKGCAWSDEVPELAPAFAVPSAEPAAAAPAPSAAAGAQSAPLSDPAAMAVFNQMMVANAMNAASRIRTLEEEFHKQNKRWPKSLNDIGYHQTRVALDHEGTVLASITLQQGGMINVLIEGGVFNGKLLSLKPRESGYGYSWACSGGGISADYLPAGCR